MSTRTSPLAIDIAWSVLVFNSLPSVFVLRDGSSFALWLVRRAGPAVPEPIASARMIDR